MLVEVFAGIVKSAHNGADRAAQTLCNLFVGESFNPAKKENAAVHRRQTTQSLRDKVTHLAFLVLAVTSTKRADGNIARRRPTLPLPQPVNARVHRYPINPR